MDNQKVEQFLAANGKFFPAEKIPAIKQRLLDADESKAAVVECIGFKDPTMLLVISILVGALGVDRFMLGDIGLGVAKLLTAGGCGIWSIVDWCIITNKTKEYNYNELMKNLI
ncbi:MAG: TM2 domain-containing protein [Clostridia bacterium]|nr:TM2 domain-containing protein [Clostridia bacterium]